MRRSDHAVGAILFASTFPWRFTSVKPISLALHFGFGNEDNVFAPFFKNLGDPDPVLSLSVDSRTVAQLDPWKHAKFANLKGPPYAQ